MILRHVAVSWSSLLLARPLRTWTTISVGVVCLLVAIYLLAASLLRRVTDRRTNLQRDTSQVVDRLDLVLLCRVFITDVALGIIVAHLDLGELIWRRIPVLGVFIVFASELDALPNGRLVIHEWIEPTTETLVDDSANLLTGEVLALRQQ